MKQKKEKTEAQKTVEQLDERKLPKDAAEAIKQKQQTINREVTK